MLWRMSPKPSTRARMAQVKADIDRAPGRSGSNCARRFLPELGFRQGRDVSVPNDGVRKDAFAFVRLDSRCAAVFDDNAGHSAAEPKHGASRLRQIAQRLGQTRHSAMDDPDALPLDVGDKHQRRWGEERRRTAVGRVSAEKLAQTRIGRNTPPKRATWR